MQRSSLKSKSPELDLLPGFVSFIVGLFYELEMGIFFGELIVMTFKAFKALANLKYQAWEFTL